jgi:hypothetical protein
MDSVDYASQACARLSNLASLTLIIEGLESSIQCSSETRKLIQNFQETESFSSIWTKFATSASDTDYHGCDKHEVCSVSLARVRRQLIVAICALFLSCSSRHVFAPVALAAPSSVDVLKRLCTQFIPKSCDSHESTRSHSRVSIAEVVSTPQNTAPSHDWRARIARDLVRDSSRTYDSIIRSVGEVCRDLEHRCESVEQPVRDLGAKLSSTEGELDAARKRIHELQSQTSQDHESAGALQSENSELRAQIHALQANLETLNADLRSAQENETTALEESERASKNAQESLSLKELEFRAADAAKDEVMEAQRRELELCQASLEETREQLQAANVKKDASSKKIVILEEQLQTADDNLAEFRTISKLGQENLTRLEIEKEKLSSNIEDLKGQLVEANSRSDSLQSELEETRKSHIQELESRDELHQRKLNKITEECADALRSKDLQISSLNSDIAAAESQTTSNLRVKDSTISSLQFKTQKLEKRLKEFYDMQKAMTALVASNSPTETPARPLRRYTDSRERRNTETPYCDPSSPHGRTVNKIQLPVGSFDGPRDSSSSNSGPTPKRPKPRRERKNPNSRRTVRFSSVDRQANLQKPDTSRRPLSELGTGNRGRKTRVRSQKMAVSMGQGVGGAGVRRAGAVFVFG